VERTKASPVEAISVDASIVIIAQTIFRNFFGGVEVNDPRYVRRSGKAAYYLNQVALIVYFTGHKNDVLQFLLFVPD